MSLLLSEYWQQFVASFGIVALAALGLYVCFIAGQFSLAHGALMAAGAYAAALVATKTGLPFWVGLPVGLLAGAAAGALVGLLALRLRDFYLAIGTLAFTLAVNVVIVNTRPLGGPLGLAGVSLDTTADVALGVLLLGAAAVWSLERTRLGRALRAVHEDEDMAAANGVRVWLVKLASFAIGGALTGLAGALFVHSLGLVRPEQFGFERSINLLVPVIVGGIATFGGPIVGAALVVLLPELINRFLAIDVLYLNGALLILAMLFRPGGLVTGHELRGIGRLLGRGSGTAAAPDATEDSTHGPPQEVSARASRRS